MSALSDYLEDALLKHLFRNTALSAPANIYVALFTAAPSDAGGGTEVSGGSYARVAVNTTSGWTAPYASGAETATDNVGTITFPTATASWGTVTHFGLFDALSGGNLLFHGALTASKTVASGDTIRFNANQLVAKLG